jgi:uncharacterized protein (TIGR02466 family)
MWANINRSGDANEFHSHPGAYWSGVYYVDDWGIADDPSLGGELEFMDPRGSVPLMNAPHLRMAGNLTAGATETDTAQAGRMVIFPAWVMHGVRPYRGTSSASRSPSISRFERTADAVTGEALDAPRGRPSLLVSQWTPETIIQSLRLLRSEKRRHP